ncbi:MAG TPA: sodium:proton antiporter [Nitrospiria bacterium]|nr:sodium:proton antiporter [Nitrospiria bacterium]
MGNGPNLLVKGISEASGVKVPTFWGYIFRYSIPILIPIYLLIWGIFFMQA